MSSPAPQHFHRTDSSESKETMLPRAELEGSDSEAGEKRERRRQWNPLWLAVGTVFIVALQVASTTGLYVYFTMSISKLKAQTRGISEELRCLQIINKMEDVSDPIEFDLDGLILNESCQKLASSIKSYITQVTESIVQRIAVKEERRSVVNIPKEIPHREGFSESSAHLTLQQGTSLVGRGSSGTMQFGNPPQSCRFPIRQWDLKSHYSHMQNMTYQDGLIKITQDGFYYVYAQIYFRYTQNQGSSSLGHQLVQCINKKTSYVNPILLLKGVGTKCWAPNAEYGLHSVHQGGVFHLRSGDDLFVSVSSLDMVYADAASSFFGAFRLGL
ncbi:hypothetical protein GDO86_015249 [Hymenochirus boettgeri]|uniref:Tumor necrosis factor ligand superfamily member 10 n=1 Tax=Hymenochirus boettgeri TaxID=247094 RepID=A0A8T2JX61_9PIPI|nr:hypothetical protein GDO86_015249 [Hymenochirus boettgeri]KAG8448085.1 hypothetical protein GDO86_015249 [Hymenochirus boettgeri]